RISCTANSSSAPPRAPGSWSKLPWSSVIHIPLNTTLSVRAVPNPGPTFPGGYPKWTGLVNNTGSATISITFSQLSTNATDYKIENVNCGHTVVCKAVVFDYAGNYAPDYDFTNRATNIFGAGELLNLGASISPADLSPSQVAEFEWQISAGGGELTGGTTDGSDTYCCPAIASDITLSLYCKPLVYRNSVGGYIGPFLPPAIGNFLVIMPSGLVFHKVPDPSATNGLWHVPGYYSIGFWAKIEVLPSYVSWDRIQLEETTNQTAAVTGSLTVLDPVHKSSATDIPAKLMTTGTEWLVMLAGSGDFIGQFYQGTRTNGTFTWHIQWNYRSKGLLGNWSVYTPVGAPVLTEFTSDQASTASAQKGLAGPYYRQLNDSTTMPHTSLPAMLQTMLRQAGIIP
ncbi:MAG: hypothetical protein ABMA26_11965, partial [Limisphaerales bacterium]